MTDHWHEKWEKQRKGEIEKFTAGWNWESVFLTWSNRMSDYPVSFKPLFTEVWVHDPEYPIGRQNVLSWWPQKRINELQLNFQRHLDHFPGTKGPINPYSYRQGELDTLCYLWAHKENKEKIAAILINASLFTRLHSSRKQYPKDHWPPYYCVEELSNWAYKLWNSEKEFSAWQHYHTEVLPYMNCDYEFKLNDMSALVRYLADEHALVFLNHKPVSIEFKEKHEPFIQRILNEEYSIKQKQLEEVRESLSKKTINRINQTHTQLKDNNKWLNISKDELERLVWTKPTIILAQEFGVSDVAITKRCKSLGIPKPKRGFWAKVNSGLIPHPQGKPIENGGNYYDE